MHQFILSWLIEYSSRPLLLFRPCLKDVKNLNDSFIQKGSAGISKSNLGDAIHLFSKQKTVSLGVLRYYNYLCFHDA